MCDMFINWELICFGSTDLSVWQMKTRWPCWHNIEILQGGNTDIFIVTGTEVVRWNIFGDIYEDLWVLHWNPVGVLLSFLSFTPVPNFNVWLPTASILDQALTLRIMWSCYGNLGTMLIISNYTNTTQRAERNSVWIIMGMWCGGNNMTNPDHRGAMKKNCWVSK